MTHPLLFALPSPPTPGAWCRLIRGDVTEAIEAAREAGGADLVIADPPWSYDGNVADSPKASNHYDCLPMGAILDHLRMARMVARPGSRLALWCTWAMLPEFAGTGGRSPGGWRWISGGAWGKLTPEDDQTEGRGMVGRPGIGYHLRSSDCEPLLVLLGPGPHARADVPGWWVEATSAHSAKPVEWQARMVSAWCPPGGVVLDLYAGLGSVARAVARAGEGRRYIGAEIDEQRHAWALSLLAQGGVR